VCGFTFISFRLARTNSSEALTVVSEVAPETLTKPPAPILRLALEIVDQIVSYLLPMSITIYVVASETPSFLALFGDNVPAFQTLIKTNTVLAHSAIHLLYTTARNVLFRHRPVESPSDQKSQHSSQSIVSATTREVKDHRHRPTTGIKASQFTHLRKRALGEPRG